MNLPGPLIGEGRAADVYDIGDGMVLRRYRSDHDVAPEGRIMTWLRGQGFPVPAVHRAEGRDLVMERIAGPTMLEDLEARPWSLVRHARTLAALQRRLHAYAAPDFVEPRNDVLPGGSLLHLDLHPMNVLLSPDGPVVIDWTNATIGDPAFDAAMSYILMATYEVSGFRDRVGQRVMVGAFARARGRHLTRAGLGSAGRLRLADRNVTPGERANLERLLERTST